LDTSQFLALVHDGWISNYPLAVGSILSLSIFVERLLAFRGAVAGTRSLTRDTIQALVQRDMNRAKEICEGSKQPIAQVFLEAMNWKNVPLEDLERVLSTSRQETSFRLKRGLWLIGTVGSLAPYVGLFGTVVGIIRAFGDMAEHGAGGFEVVAAGISEALIATAAGLAVAIIALTLFNFLQTRVGAIAAVYSRSCERFVQALLYVEASTDEGEEDPGGLVPA
jgi:biopolymer transport protein ExbB